MIDNRTLTACVVIHNEEKVLRRCIESILPVTQNILVVHDGKCSDQSIAIARECGCRVKIRPWLGDAEPHRAWAYTHIKSDWILQIDGDEYLTKEMQKKLPSLVKTKNISCFEFLWPHWNGSKYTTKIWPTKKALFLRKKIIFLGTPHQEVRPLGRIVKTDLTLGHKPLKSNHDIRTIRTKWTSWARVQAKYFFVPQNELPHYPKSSATLRPHYEWLCKRPLLSIPFVFFYHFCGGLWNGALSEGVEGIKIAFYNAVYYIFVCIEVYKLKKSYAKTTDH